MNTLNIPNISCGHCARAVTEAVQALDPQARVEVNVAAHTASIESRVPLHDICERLAAEGYPATPA